MTDKEKLLITLQNRINDGRNRHTKTTTIFISTLSACMKLLKEESELMCPKCDNIRTYIIETREDDGYSVRRRRKCPVCGHRFTTYERMAQAGILRQKEKR